MAITAGDWRAYLWWDFVMLMVAISPILHVETIRTIELVDYVIRAAAYLLTSGVI